jgi:hypothetical protein
MSGDGETPKCRAIISLSSISTRRGSRLAPRTTERRFKCALKAIFVSTVQGLTGAKGRGQEMTGTRFLGARAFLAAGFIAQPG